MCVIAWEVGEVRFIGDLNVRQYVCSGPNDEGLAGNLTGATGCTSAAILSKYSACVFAQFQKCRDSMKHI